MPARVLPALDQIVPSLAEAGHVLLLSDYDGTLTPIQPRPELCHLSDELHGILTTLASLNHCTVGIVSGRELADIESRLGIRKAHYIGNHGLEIKTGDVVFVDPAADALRDPLRSISVALNKDLTGIPGAWVQDKQLSLSIHFRQVDSSRHLQVLKLVEEKLAQHSSPGQFELHFGKMVTEVRPAIPCNKGIASRWLHQRLQLPVNTRVIYLGDDTTDEDAFVVWRDEITIHVGNSLATHANYLLSDPAAVHVFLFELLKTLLQRAS
jgi:trehalose 6-phosphate phosphatase